jgi:uracil-DNA glycosylase
MNNKWKGYIDSIQCNKILNKIDFDSDIIFPERANIFRAFEMFEPEELKVVIVGQDPYHGESEANGLAFAVNKGMKIPPSLRNILKEIKADYPESTTPQDLLDTAHQGVLLLNRVLTVVKDQPASHKDIGWMEVTENIIKQINLKHTNIVYILWGKHAEKLKDIIYANNNLILISGHPSPFSARLFHGNRHFRMTNEYLISKGKVPIIW